MQSSVNSFESVKTSESFIDTVSAFSESSHSTPDGEVLASDLTMFKSHFVDHMEMAADAQVVAAYLDTHHEWFRRCAQPMTVSAIGDNSYALLIGKFGSFGYEVEPKIGLNLLPQDGGVYRIETVPVPGYVPMGYDVDFTAAMELVEQDGAALESGETLTHVQWQLDLTVKIQFPRFIQALPKGLVQSTGERLLRNIVRQVSNRLTRKVQADFHTAQGLPIPKRQRRRG
jgi:hypothetical protein